MYSTVQSKSRARTACTAQNIVLKKIQHVFLLILSIFLNIFLLCHLFITHSIDFSLLRQYFLLIPNQSPFFCFYSILYAPRFLYFLRIIFFSFFFFFFFLVLPFFLFLSLLLPFFFYFTSSFFILSFSLLQSKTQFQS